MSDQNKSKILINNFIKYLKKTQDSEWLMDKCADTPELEKCCIFAHLFKFAGGKPDGEDTPKSNYKATRIMDCFEQEFATTFMLYPVNDGKDKNYQQTTPKQRCIAYLKDLRDGKAETTAEGMEREYNLWSSGGGDE